MKKSGRLTSPGDEPIEHEIPDPPPEGNKGIHAGGDSSSMRVAMRVIVPDDGPIENELPDPPPEGNKG